MITFSPEFAPSKGFYSRPELRPFVTCANWDGDLEGFIGGGPGDEPYGNNTDGFTFGVQFET